MPKLPPILLVVILTQASQVGYPQPGILYDLAHGSGNDPYAGLDRFGRVVDLHWSNQGTSATIDRAKHGYDRASNRLWRENAALPSGVDELYANLPAA